MIMFLTLVLSVVCHEVAHGWAALEAGDRTAQRAGRLTLNPFAHVDPVFTVLLPMCMIALTGVAIAFGKPVPINYGPMSHRTQIKVASAGILANGAVAVFAWGVGWTTLLHVNLMLVAFNLLPIPPLDGWRIFQAVRYA